MTRWWRSRVRSHRGIHGGLLKIITNEERNHDEKPQRVWNQKCAMVFACSSIRRKLMTRFYSVYFSHLKLESYIELLLLQSIYHLLTTSQSFFIQQCLIQLPISRIQPCLSNLLLKLLTLWNSSSNRI